MVDCGKFSLRGTEAKALSSSSSPASLLITFVQNVLIALAPGGNFGSSAFGFGFSTVSFLLPP
jgi:hypothetical protein